MMHSPVQTPLTQVGLEPASSRLPQLLPSGRGLHTRTTLLPLLMRDS